MAKKKKERKKVKIHHHGKKTHKKSKRVVRRDPRTPQSSEEENNVILEKEEMPQDSDHIENTGEEFTQESEPTTDDSISSMEEWSGEEKHAEMVSEIHNMDETSKVGSNDYEPPTLPQMPIKASSVRAPIMKVREQLLPRRKVMSEKDIAMDFAMKVHSKFDRLVKASVLFGSQTTAKDNAVEGSDIDIILIVDDAAIEWDLELVAWYRE